MAGAGATLDLHGKNVIVTGGAGFLGSKLVRQLVEKYKCSVRIVDNLWRGDVRNIEGIDAKLQMGDLADSSVAHALIKKADIVFHLADVVGGIHFVFGNQHFVFRQNMMINMNVIAACLKNKIKNYVYVGTACSYPEALQKPDPRHPDRIVALAEDKVYPAAPESSYGWSKLMGEYEAELLRTTEGHRINVGIARLHNVYGLGQSYDPATSQVLPALCRKAILNPQEPFDVWGTGRQYRDFVHCDDIIRGILLTAERGLNHGPIQLGSGQATRIREAAFTVAKIAEQEMGKRITPHFDTSKPSGDFGRIAVLGRANSILGWRPQVPFYDGMVEMFRWIRTEMAKDSAREEVPRIPQFEPSFDNDERRAMNHYMMKGGWLMEFRETQKLEKRLAEYTGAKHCIMVPNGTVSLVLALKAFGVGPGDEVIVPAWTMVATPASVDLIGAKIVFADIDRRTHCIGVEHVSRAMTSRTKAVFHVSLNGQGGDIRQLAAFCKSRGVPLIEDAAQSLGSFVGGQHLGTFGDIGSFSFSVPKIITMGQGGALVTNDDAIAANIRKLKNFGRARGGIDTHDVVGWNFKITDMQAVIGLQQFNKLPDRVKRIKQVWRLYYDGLEDVPQVEMMDFHKDPEWKPWFVEIYLQSQKGREDLAAKLKGLHIGTRSVYPPLHHQECYSDHRSARLPVTEDLAPRGLWLPSSSTLSDVQTLRVINAIRTHFGATALSALRNYTPSICVHKPPVANDEEVPRVLIVGGAGFIGTVLVRTILSSTNWNVRVLDRLMYGGRQLHTFISEGKERFQFKLGDVRKEDLDSILEDVDFVVNLAAYVGEHICQQWPRDAYETNLEANVRLARACQRKGIKRYIFASTCSNYGLPDDPEVMCDEDSKLIPLGLYAQTKVDCERILLKQLPDLPVTVVRFATVYGMAPRVRFDLLLHELTRDAWVDKEILIYGPRNWRPITHVDDAAAAVTTILQRHSLLPKKIVFNVGSNDQNFRKIELAKMIQTHIPDSKIRIVHTINDPRNYKVRFDKIYNYLGFKCKHRPTDTVGRIVASLKSGLISKEELFLSVNKGWGPAKL